MRLHNRELEWLWTELAHGVETRQPLPALTRELAASRARGRLGRALNALAVAPAKQPTGDPMLMPGGKVAVHLVKGQVHVEPPGFAFVDFGQPRRVFRNNPDI